MREKTPLQSRREFLRTTGATVIAASSLALRPARAAGYPERPVRIIVPFAPGGPTDIMARIVASRLGEAINGTVIVDNRPGAGGNIGIGLAAHAEGDGYTLLITQCDPGRSQAWHQFDCRPRRTRQGEPERIELCEPRHWHHTASVRRAL